MGRALLLWLIGIPIPIILIVWLLADCTADEAWRKIAVGNRQNGHSGPPGRLVVEAIETIYQTITWVRI